MPPPVLPRPRLATLRALVSLGLAGVLPTALPATDAPPAAVDWAGDLAALRRELPARHKDLFFSVPPAEFERQLDTLSAALPLASDLATALRLQEIVVSLGDDHTAVDWTPLAAEGTIFPLGLHWFTDGWRVLVAPENQASLLGRKVVAIGGVPMPEIEQRGARLLSRDNPWLVKHRLPNILPFAGVLQHLGLAADNRVVVTCADEAGQPTDTVVPFVASADQRKVKRVQYRPATPPYSTANQRPILKTHLFAADRIYYIHYNRCEGRETAERLGDKKRAAELPSLADGFAKILAELRPLLRSGQAEKIVFDVQFNPGGASDFGSRFARDLAALPDLREPGRVFVIVGRRTFSSAIINAMDFKELLGAVIVGEPTSGTPDHFGEVRQFTLPSSHLRVGYSTKRFGDAAAAFVPLQPDLVAAMSFADYAAGHDAALEAVRHYVPAKQTAAPASPVSSPAPSSQETRKR